MSTNDEFIFDAIRSRYEFEHTVSSALDGKIGTILGWVGAVLTIILYVGGIVYTSPATRPDSLSQGDVNILTVAVILLVGSVLAGVVAFRGVSYRVIPKPMEFIDAYKNEPDKTRTLRELAFTMAKGTEYNRNQNARKVNLIAVTLGLFAAGLALSTLFIIIQVGELVTPKS